MRASPEHGGRRGSDELLLLLLQSLARAAAAAAAAASFSFSRSRNARNRRASSSPSESPSSSSPASPPSSDAADAEGECSRLFFFPPLPFSGEGDGFRFFGRSFFPGLAASFAFASSTFRGSSRGGGSRSGDGDGLGVFAHMNIVLDSFSRLSRRKSA